MSDALTTVSYDVSAAISALEQLDDKVKQSGKTAEDAFNKGGAASAKYEGEIGGLANQLLSGAGSTAFFANQTLELAGHLGEAAEKAIAFTESIAEQGFGFETAVQKVDEFIARLDSIAKTVQGAIDIGNAAQNAALQRQLFLTSRSQLAAERSAIGAITAEQQGLQIRLSGAKQFYSQLDAIANKSAQTRKEAEDKLNSLVAGTNERRFLASISRFSENAQISKLIDQADRLEKQGGKNNLESAQNLLDKALSKAQDSGQGANVRRVESAFDGLINKRREDAAAADKQATSDKAAADSANKVTAAILAQSQALRTKQTSLQTDIQNSALQRAEDKRKQEDNLRQQAFDTAQRDLRKQLVELDKASQTPTTIFDRAKGLLSNVKEISLPESEFRTQKDNLEQALALRDKIDARIKANPTPAGIKGAAGDQAALKALLEELVDIPNLSGSLQPDVDKLQRSVDLYDKIQKSAEATAAASGRIDGGRPDTLPPVRPNGPVNTNANPVNAAPQNKTVTQNIQVDMNVRGGMIDPETIQQISERVSREIRKGTVN